MFVLIACATCGSPLPLVKQPWGDWEGRDYRFELPSYPLHTTRQHPFRGRPATQRCSPRFSGVPAQVNYPHVSVSAPNGFTLLVSFKRTARFLATEAREQFLSYDADAGHVRRLRSNYHHP